jgi:hypothetical protein
MGYPLPIIAAMKLGRPATLAGCPAVHDFQTDPIKSVEAPLDLYIRILTGELTPTTLFL